MLGSLLGGFIDKEKLTHDTIQNCLEAISDELQCSYEELFIMIKPIDKTFTMKFHIYRLVDGKPTYIREITLKEILSDE